MSNSIARYDRGEVRGDATITPEGYVRANAVVTRTGIFNYQNPDGTIRKELRHPEDVWHEDSINSMFMIPVTNDHPKQRLVDASNFKELSVGYTGESVKKQGQFVLANFVVNDSEGVKAIQNGKRELSLGYTVDLDETPGIYNGQSYDARQTNIRYNHLALVNKARAGESARIVLDSADAVEISENEDNMGKRKIKIDADEVFVEPQVGDYVDRLETDMKNLTDEKDRVTRELADKEAELARVNDEIESIRKQLEMTEAERDGLKTAVKDEPVISTSYDSAEFIKAVNSRVDLIKKAEKHLGSATNLDSLTNVEIKKSVVKKLRPTISLDSKSEIYVETLFDVVIDDASSKVNIKGVEKGTINNDELKHDPKLAREAMLEKLSKGTK